MNCDRKLNLDEHHQYADKAGRRTNPLLFISSDIVLKSKKISNAQELIQSDPISCPQNQKGNN